MLKRLHKSLVDPVCPVKGQVEMGDDAFRETDM